MILIESGVDQVESSLDTFLGRISKLRRRPESAQALVDSLAAVSASWGLKEAAPDCDLE